MSVGLVLVDGTAKSVHHAQGKVNVSIAGAQARKRPGSSSVPQTSESEPSP